MKLLATVSRSVSANHHFVSAPPSSLDTFRDFRRLFHQLDEDGDGKISPVELQSCMKTLGEELSREDAEAVVRCSDADGDGLLSFEEFIELANAEDGEEEKGKGLREAFGVYATDGEGCITPNSLSRALDRLGKPATVEECLTMIRRFDINGDGVICFDEFKAMML